MEIIKEVEFCFCGAENSFYFDEEYQNEIEEKFSDCSVNFVICSNCNNSKWSNSYMMVEITPNNRIISILYKYCYNLFLKLDKIFNFKAIKYTQ